MKHCSWLFLSLFCLNAWAADEFPPEILPEEGVVSAPDVAAPAAEDESPSETGSGYLKPKKQRVPPPVERTRRVKPASRPPADRAESGFGFELDPSVTVSVIAGYGTLSESNTSNDAYLGNNALRDHFQYGLGVEGQLNRYLGAEIELQIGSTPPNELAVNNIVEETHQFRNLSMIAGLRGGLPLSVGKATVTPRLTLGFALGKLSQKSTDTSPVINVTHEISLSGFYLGGGLDVNFNDWISAFLDYGMTLGASGTFTSTGTSTVNEGFPAAGFTRLRLGGTFRVVGPLHLGPLLVLRKFNGDAAAHSGVKIGEGDNLLQVLALITAKF